jgi:hypothetical protein
VWWLPESSCCSSWSLSACASSANGSGTGSHVGLELGSDVSHTILQGSDGSVLVLLFHLKFVDDLRGSTDDTISNGTHKLHYLFDFQKNKGWKGGKLLKVWSISVGELSTNCFENFIENIFIDEC